MSERDVFTAALHIADAAARSAYLDRACAGDAPLRQRVELLLRAHGSAGDFLERPADALASVGGTPAPDATATLDPAGRPAPAAPRTVPGDEDEDAPLDFLQPSTKPGSLGRLGHYEVLEVLGRGGFGIVLRAFDELLHRVVAVKIMAPQLAATSPARKRFLREARAAAAVRHDNVVAIYNVEEQPIPYLVMEFIAGETVQQRLDRVGPLDATEVARIGRQIAAGLAEAHAMGLIHRDVKPSNILLESGADRVKITDFGLARAADDASLTQSGMIAGTPMYMAPEQAKGEVIGHRADLFSLGSVLYVMCSGRPPFRASTTLAVLKRVAEDSPRPIREIIPEVPEWLCAIIARLHAKEPEDRFQTAAEVAAVLGQRPQPSATAAPPLVRPDPHVLAAASSRGGVRSAALAVTAVVLTAVAAVAVFVALQRGDRRDPPADPGVALVKPGGQQPPQPGPEPWQPRPPLTQAELNQLPSPLDGRKRSEIPQELLALAGGGDPAKAPAELVAVLGNTGPFTFPGWATSHYPVVSPDGKSLAASCGNTLAVFDTATGACQRTLTGAPRRVHIAGFAPDGKRIGVGCDDANAYVWDSESGKLELTLEGHPDAVFGIAFSPDGKRIATGCNDGSLFLWDADGKNKTALAKQPRPVQMVAFSPDSKTLASAGNNGVVVLWDTATAMEVQSLKGHTSAVWIVRYSADGKTLASGGVQTILWDLATGMPRHTLPTSGLGLLAFTADSKGLLTADCNEKDGVYHLARWDPVTGEQTANVPLGPRRKGVENLRLYAASLDGTTVYACHHGGDDRASVFDAVTGKERLPQANFHTGPVWAVAVSPDGKTLATGGQDHTIRLWNLAAWKPGAVLPPCCVLEGHTKLVWSLAFSPDSQLLASGGTDGIVILWNTASGKKLRDPFGRIGTWWSRLAFSPDGRTVACPQEDGSVILYEIGSAEKVSWHWHKVRAQATAFSPDGKLVASASHDGEVSVAERASGQQLKLVQAGSEAFSVAFGRNSRTLATTGGRQLLTWDLADTKKTITLSGHTAAVIGLALHPAGRLAATGSWDGTVRVWDLPTGRSGVFNSGRGFEGRVDGMAFTPEGRYLVAGSAAGFVCIWKTPEFPALKQGPPAAGPIDLLKLVDPHKDTVKGIWTRQKTDLVASGGEAILELPYWPPAEYDLLVELTLDPQQDRNKANEVILFPVAREGTGRVSWFIDGSGQLCQAVPGVVGSLGMPFQAGEKYQFEVRVRRDRVTVKVNGRDTGTYWSSGRAFAQGENVLRGSGFPGVWCNTETTYHRIEVREVSGAGTFIRAQKAAPDLKAP